MQRYFFHVFDGKDEIDTEGTVLENDDEAREQAVIYATELLSAGAGDVRAGDALRVDVQDGEGNPMFCLDFRITDTSPKSASPN